MIASVATVTSVWISSSRRPAEVDGMAITAAEQKHIRALRTSASKMLAKVAENKASRVAEIMTKISREGLPDAPPPRISAKPPVPELD